MNAQILAALTAEQIYGGSVQLHPNGTTKRGLCPFHREETPSFVVYPDKHFHCFGCNAHGSAFDFIMCMERIDFAEAKNRLATLAGISLDANALDRLARWHQRQGEKLDRAAEALAAAEMGTLRHARSELHQRLALRRNAAERLKALLAVDPARCPDEVEAAWEALQLIAIELPRADAAYCIAALAASKQRYAFALHPEGRSEMIGLVLESGFVTEAKGFRFEVPT